MSRAYLLYAEAAALDPHKHSYWQRADAVRSRAAMESKPKLATDAEPPSDPASPEEPPHFDSMTAKDLAEARQPRPANLLQAKPGRQNIDVRGDGKSLFEQVSTLFGLQSVFDSDYTPTPSFRFRMDDADYRDALHGLEAATNSFVVPLSSNLILVAVDTMEKRNDLEQTMSVTIPVPQALNNQELIEMAQAIRQTVGIEKMSWDVAAGQVFIRDRVSRVLAAQKLFQDLLTYRSQVVIELQFIEVHARDMLTYGFELQSNFPLVFLGQFLNYKGSIPSALSGLALFGGGRTLLGIGLTDASFFANMSKTSARTLLKTEIRSVDGQPATLKIGDKYPVLTGGYLGTITQPGAVFRPPPSYTFEDLGISLKVTPHVHGMDEVSLDIESEFKVLTGQALNGVPIISNRQINSKVRLINDQWAIAAGLMTESNTKTITGIGGLSREKQKDRAEVLVLMKPRLIGLPPDQIVTRPYRVGSESRTLTPL